MDQPIWHLSELPYGQSVPDETQEYGIGNVRQQLSWTKNALLQNHGTTGSYNTFSVFGQVTLAAKDIP